MNKEISIILPVYNEKESLNIMVRLLNSTLKIKNEILIVHDSLEDNSLIAAHILQKEFTNVKIIHNSSTIAPSTCKSFAINKIPSI